MVTHIMLCSSCVRYLFLQIFVLQVLHRKAVVVVAEPYVLLLLVYQHRYNIIHYAGSHVYKQQEHSVACIKRSFKAGLAVVVIEHIVPYQIEGRRYQPQIPPLDTCRLFFNCGSIHLFCVDEKRYPHHRQHNQHYKRERPAVRLYSKLRKNLSFYAL